MAGSPVAAWSKGNELNKRLLDKLREITKVYEITDILWHQGEKDLSWGISLNQYRKSFSSMVLSLREIGVYAPIYISVASYCKEDCRFNCGEYPNNITKAQISLANELSGVVLGVNTDELVTPNMRYDNCHFNEEGQRSAAREAARIITSYHQ